MELPQELEEAFQEEIYRFEEARHMPYVTSIERLALARGLADGLREAIVLELETKFGAAGKKRQRKLRAVQTVEQLRTVLRALKTAQTVEEIQLLLD